MTLPNTVEELLQLLDEKLTPEPTPTKLTSREEMLWDSARRSVYLQLRALREAGVPQLLREQRGQGRVRRQDT